MTPHPKPAAPQSPDVTLGLATRLLWRANDAVHLELGERGVVVERLPHPVIDRVTSSAARHPGHVASPDVVDALVELTDRGFLWPRPDSADRRPRAPTPRLTGELVSLAHAHGDRAAEMLSARQRASIVVEGHPRLGTHLAALLAAAGVGRVRYAARGSAHLSHAAPGGVEPGDEGRDLDTVTSAAIERHAPEVDTLALPVGVQPDLTVLVLDTPHDEDRRHALHVAGAAHLAVTTAPDGGSVGPLVLPGLTSCLRCADLHRRDRDPAWPALAAQLCVPRRYAGACDVAGESIIAGTAASQALAYLDTAGIDGPAIASIEGTIEFHRPDWRLRRRTRPAHPDCDCGAPSVQPWAE